MGTIEDFENLWTNADVEDFETQMARRRMVARLVAQTVGHRDEIDSIVDWLLDETHEIDRATLDEMTWRAHLNKRHPMENANPSKTEINRHIRQICNLAKRHEK